MIEIGLNLLVTCSRKVHKLNFEIITEAEIREKCKKKLPNSFMLYRLSINKASSQKNWGCSDSSCPLHKLERTGISRLAQLTWKPSPQEIKDHFQKLYQKLKKNWPKQTRNPPKKHQQVPSREILIASYEVSRSTPLLTNHPVTTETEPLWSIRSPETVAFYEFTAGTDYVADNVAN